MRYEYVGYSQSLGAFGTFGFDIAFAVFSRSGENSSAVNKVI